MKNTMLESLELFIPEDRRIALARGETLPDRSRGAALIADVSGFTALTEALAHELGARRGIDELSQQLNRIYEVLISEVHRYRGSVITFSGDAILCWFDGDDGLRGTACALAMQAAITRLGEVKTPSGARVPLAIKVAVTAGPARRFLVGDPEIQYIDVVAGSTLDRLDAAEDLARQGEVVLGPEVVASLDRRVEIGAWRDHGEAGLRFATAARLTVPVEASPWPDLSAGAHIESHRTVSGAAEGLVDAQLRSWLLPPVYDRLKAGRSRFLAELRPAVALFARFAGLDYDRDDRAGEKLDAYTRWVQSILAYYEGFLIQLVTGDKGSYMYAAFGAPIAHDDDAGRAVAVALQLQSPPPGLEFIKDIQIGVTKGRMRTGAYGSSTRRTYGVLGSEVNIAARLMSTARPAQILISKRVADAAARRYCFEHLADVTVKGRQEPIPVFQVAGELPDLPARPGPLPDAALPTQVEQVIELAAGGQGQILRIEGPAVSGGAFVEKLLDRAEAHNFDVALAAGQMAGRDEACAPWPQLLRAWFGLVQAPAAGEEPDAWQAGQIDQLKAAVTGLNPDWLPLLPLLGELFELPIPDNSATEILDPLLRQGVLLALCIEIVKTRAGEQPLLLLIEQAHRLDEMSRKLAAAIGRTLAGAPVLLVLAHPAPGEAAQSPLPALSELANHHDWKLGDGAGPVTARQGLASDRDAPVLYPVIGRTAERVMLMGQVQALLYGHVGGVVIVEGESGIGKSRLVEEVLDRARTLKLTCVAGAGSPLESSTPYFAWRFIFRQILDLELRPEASPSRRDQILAGLSDAPHLARLAPLLNAVLPLGFEENELTRQMSGQVRADNTRDLLLHLLQVAVAETPTVLVLEDAHWLDSASWALASLASRRLRSVLLIVVTQPMPDPLPAEYSRLLRDPGAQFLRLEGLSGEDTLTLVCQRLGVTGLPESVAALIQTKAEGHPFYSEELAYALRDAGVIQIVDGQCRVAPGLENLSAIDLPDTVEGVITSRIDRLPPPQQLTLKVASVIGRTFLFRLLQAVHPIETDREQLPAYLEGLERQDITRRETIEPDLAYIFKHVITQEVTYHLMPFSQRRDLHQAVAAWLEQTYARDLTPFYPLLAHHWRQVIADRPIDPALANKIFAYLEKAGEQALRDDANREAARFFSDLLDLHARWEAQPAAPAGGPPARTQAVSPARQARWRRHLGESYLSLGRVEESHEHFRLGAVLLGYPEPAGPAGFSLSLFRQVLRQLYHRLRPFPARSKARSRAALLEAARTYERLGEIYYWSTKPFRAIYAVLRMINLAEQAGPSPELARAYANMCLVTGYASLRSLARLYSHRALVTARKGVDRSALAWVLEIAGIYNIGIGQWTKARDALSRAAALAQELQDRRRWEECQTSLSEVYYLQGRFSDSLKLWREVYSSARRRGDVQAQTWALTGQLRCLLPASDVNGDKAGAALEALEALLDEEIENADRINCYGAIALMRLHLDQADLAREAIDAACQLIDQSPPTGFGLIHGYTSAAEVYLTLWETGRPAASPAAHRHLVQSAHQTCRALHRYARAFPIGQPRAWLWQGLYDWLAGRPGKAQKSWQKSLMAARRLGAPYDMALAHYEIGRHLKADDRRRAGHLEEAQTIFARLDATYDAARSRTALAG